MAGLLKIRISQGVLLVGGQPVNVVSHRDLYVGSACTQCARRPQFWQADSAVALGAPHEALACAELRESCQHPLDNV
eukprot:CAMPEP_0174351720 /NCGR_PEP_ID=MMETSP0811_2-20130205/9164_1 /TAXON_ID=73025 ORGANISM="Eutreptiella gymnastica-like, Strain CCMP1594" /NCGR_SAMPLE_ID=MMETSP0811_2 /ASSEMBLY_ACC=CAM_ASM_000667 /LENGTH=76 /DNA_ID=CAMNT_0015481209 /DNA_START=575 /DNA_END=806 /DNA_ORIENTATION=+